MIIRFQCRCGKRFRVSSEHTGKHAKCKHCGAALTIPSNASTEPEDCHASDLAVTQAPAETEQGSTPADPVAIGRILILSAPKQSFLVAPEIPPDEEARARDLCSIPSHESIVGVARRSFIASREHQLAITDAGLRWHNPSTSLCPGPGWLDFGRLSGRFVTPLDEEVSIGCHQTIATSGLKCGRDGLLRVLEAMTGDPAIQHVAPLISDRVAVVPIIGKFNVPQICAGCGNRSVSRCLEVGIKTPRSAASKLGETAVRYVGYQTMGILGLLLPEVLAEAFRDFTGEELPLDKHGKIVCLTIPMCEACQQAMGDAKAEIEDGESPFAGSSLLSRRLLGMWLELQFGSSEFTRQFLDSNPGLARQAIDDHIRASAEQRASGDSFAARSVRILLKQVPVPGLVVAVGNPSKEVEAARKACDVSNDVMVLAVFQNANGLILTSDGLHYPRSGFLTRNRGSGFIPLSQLKHRTIKPKGIGYLSLGDGDAVVVDTGIDTLTTLLKRIQGVA